MEFYKKLLLSSVLITIALIGVIFLFAMNFSPIITGTVSIDNNTEGGIGEAIANASVGDTILLSSGNYIGMNNTGITINKSVSLKGNGPTDEVIIDGQNLTRIFEIDDNLSVKFTNITFINAKATGNGGAINDPNNNTKMEFINCTFINNEVTSTKSADGFGGAIYSSSGDVSLVNCTFIDISSSGNGGAIYNSGVGIGLVDCTFTNIVSGGSGGAIYNGGDDIVGYDLGVLQKLFNLILNNGTGVGLVSCTFNNVSAADDGGAIYNGGNGVGLVDCAFDNIVSGSSGGAIFNNGSDMGLVSSIFTNVSATDDGGAIFNIGNDMGLVDCTFTDIVSGGSGGAIFNNGSDMGLVSSIFTNIVAADGEAISGGVNVSGVDSTFINITSTNNRG